MEIHRNKTFTLVVWGLCIVALSLGGFFLYLIVSRDKEVNTLALEARELIKKDEQLSSVRIALRESSDTLEKIDDVFINEDEISSFIDSLETLASDYGVSISIGSISVEAIPNISVSKQLRIRISSSGSWRNLVSFMAQLETLPKAVVVQKFALNKDTSSTESKNTTRPWNATFDISALILSNQP